MKRPGRFDRHVSIALPDRIGRNDIFNVHLASVKLDKEFDEFYRSSGSPKRIEKLIEDGEENLIKDGENKVEAKLFADVENIVEAMLAEGENAVSGVENVESKDVLPPAAEIVSGFDGIAKVVLTAAEKRAAEVKKDLEDKAAKLVVAKQYSKKLSKMTTGFSGADIKNICL